jgi:hypothetical protein
MNPPSDEQFAEQCADSVEWSDLYGDRRKTYKVLVHAGIQHARAELAQEIGDYRDYLKRISEGRWNKGLRNDVSVRDFAREVLAKYGEK